MSELPENWSQVRLKQVARISSGYAFKSLDYSDDGMPLLRISNIKDGSIDLSCAVRIPRSKQKPEFQVENGDILIALSGATTGKSGVYNSDAPALLNQRVGNIRPIDSRVLDKRYLWFFIKSNRKGIETAAYGGAQPNISPTDIGDFMLPLPLINEQKRIVAKLDELLPKVEACKQRLEKIPAILKRFRQSVLAAAVSGKLTEEWRKKSEAASYQECENVSFPLPSGWSVIQSKNLFSFVTSGSRGWARYYADSGAIFIRVGNLEHDDIRLDLREIQHVNPPKGAEGERTKVQPDDILISITADVGMVAHVDRDIGPAFINQHVALARPIKEKVSPRYLALYLSSLVGGQEQFKARQRGATKVGLGLEDIREIWVALPPRREQEEIIRRHDALLTRINERCNVTKAFAFVNKTQAALLSSAFSGTLVAQDPNDEQVTILLQESARTTTKPIKGGAKNRKKHSASTLAVTRG